MAVWRSSIDWVESRPGWRGGADSSGSFRRFFEQSMGASGCKFVPRAVWSVLLPHFKSAAGHRPRRMVGWRKIRDYVLTCDKIRCDANRYKSQLAQLAAAYSPGAFGHHGVLWACQ